MRRVLKLGLVFWLLLLPGGLIVALYALSKLLKASQSVLLWARIWSLSYGVPYELTEAILWNEAASEPHPATDAEASAAGVDPGTSIYPVGDMTASKGPSFGPGQVLRVNVLRLWANAGALVRPLVVMDDPAELALPGHERQALWVSVQVLREALDQAGGDLHTAARIYNGSGPAAEAYAARADAYRQGEA